MPDAHQYSKHIFGSLIRNLDSYKRFDLCDLHGFQHLIEKLLSPKEIYMDGGPETLFEEGPKRSQPAPWIKGWG